MIPSFLQKNPKIRKFDHFRKKLGDVMLAQEHFCATLRRERLRSERYGSTISIVIIDIDGMLSFLEKTNKVNERFFFGHFASFLKSSTRHSDIKGWYREGQFAVLTPNTDEVGAGCLVRNITKDLLRYPGINGRVHERDLKQFMNIASIKKGKNYLLNDNEESQQTKRFLEKKTYVVNLRKNHSYSNYSKNKPLAVGVVSWPFLSETSNFTTMRKVRLVLKRAIDIVGALTGIVLFSPIMFCIAIIIKVTSPGPVLFSQERMGLLGKPFTFLKFRTMKTNCDSSLHKEYVAKLIRGETGEINQGTKSRPVYKITSDPRITRFGRILRRSSLDELPQFFNVLKGDMSLVGPRPPISYEFTQYRRWHSRRILEVKPGITGLWQVSGRSGTTFEEMVRLDLQYARNWNLLLDFKILFKTLKTVISGKGAH